MCLVGVDVPAQAPGWFERSKSSTVDTFESTWAIDDDNSLFLVFGRLFDHRSNFRGKIKGVQRLERPCSRNVKGRSGGKGRP
jgi:hypothetical protein